jgi:hypothetical protein
VLTRSFWHILTTWAYSETPDTSFLREPFRTDIARPKPIESLDFYPTGAMLRVYDIATTSKPGSPS